MKEIQIMTNGERFKGYADGICRHFRELLKPHPEYWNLWIEKEMPWIAYLSLYYDAFTAKRFYGEFYYISRFTRKDLNSIIVRIALKNYSIGRSLISLRKMIGKIKS